MKLLISRASLFECLLPVVPWVPHGIDKSREQQPRWVLSHMTQVANRRLSVMYVYELQQNLGQGLLERETGLRPPVI